jgi:hypothetical protein
MINFVLISLLFEIFETGIFSLKEIDAKMKSEGFVHIVLIEGVIENVHHVV